MYKQTKTLVVAAALVLLSSALNAQVTIGFDGAPERAMLLELKNQTANGANVTVANGKPGGLGLPRVQLVSKNTLEPFISSSSNTPEKTAHTGMMVYNLQNNAVFKPGIYVWDGTQWMSQKSSDDAWLLDGNTGTTNKFVGTTDASPVIFKTNNTQRMNIAANGDINMSLPTTSATNVLSVVIDANGKVYRQDLGETIRPINYITYQITSNEASGDWISDFNTKISATNYTMVVVGAQLQITEANTALGISGDISVGRGTYNPFSAYAFVKNGTWRLTADYKDGGLAPTTGTNNNHAGKGTWHLYCLVIHNSLVNNMGVKTGGTTGNTSAGEVDSAPAGL